jgi:hypothetical protein
MMLDPEFPHIHTHISQILGIIEDRERKNIKKNKSYVIGWIWKGEERLSGKPCFLIFFFTLFFRVE